MITGTETLSAIQLGDRLARGHCRRAPMGKPRIRAHHSAGADEQCLAARLLHDPRVRRARRVQYRQSLVAAVDQRL